MKKSIIIFLLILSLMVSAIGCVQDLPKDNEANTDNVTDTEWETDQNIKEPADHEQAIKNPYYEMIRLSANDLKSVRENVNNVEAIIIPDYERLRAYVKGSAIDSIDEKIFEGNTVVLVLTKLFEDEIIGFRSLEIANSQTNMTCDIWGSSEMQESLIMTGAHLVLIPNSELTFSYKTAPSISFYRISEYYAKKMKSIKDFSNKDEIYVFKSFDELKSFQEENGIINHGFSCNDDSLVIAHYVKNENANKIKTIYSGASLENGVLTLNMESYLENEIGNSYQAGNLYFIEIPTTKEVAIDRVVINKSNTIINVKESKNISYDDYLICWEINYKELENAELNENQFVIITSREEYESFENIDEDSNSYYLKSREALFAEYNMVIIREYFDNGCKEVTGVINPIIAENTLNLTIDEKDNLIMEQSPIERTIKVLIKKEMFATENISSLTVEITKHKVNYYEEIGHASIVAGSYPNYSYKYNDLYVITTYLEYKGLWQDYMNEETFNKISEETFNEYNLLAIYRLKGSSAGYDIGYKNFFVDGDGIHITLDVGEEYMGDCMIYEWYSMVLIPKSYFKNGYDYDEIDICMNLIHHNYKWGYGY